MRPPQWAGGVSLVMSRDPSPDLGERPPPWDRSSVREPLWLLATSPADQEGEPDPKSRHAGHERESISQPEKLAFVAVDHARGHFGVENGLGALGLGPCGQRFGLSIPLRPPILWNPMLFASLICFCPRTVLTV